MRFTDAGTGKSRREDAGKGREMKVEESRG